MPNQMPYGFMSQNNFTPDANFSNPFMNQNYDKISELEQRISVLEQKVKTLEEMKLPKSNYDYQTSMNMM